MGPMGSLQARALPRRNVFVKMHAIYIIFENWVRIHCFLQGQIQQKTRIITESIGGGFHQVPRRHIAGRRATGRASKRQPRVSYHIEFRTVYAEAYLGNKTK